MRRQLIAAVAVLTLGIGGAARAQAVSPMTMSVSSFTDRYLVRLDVINPYSDFRTFRLAAYTADGEPVEIWASETEIILGPAAVRRVNITAPFDGAAEREIYICSETTVQTDTGSMRGQVCSRVSARRLG